MTNPTGAGNAQVQDDADRKAQKIMIEHLSSLQEAQKIVEGFVYGRLGEHYLAEDMAASTIATALREAEQREAIVWEFAVARHVGGSATRDLVKATANDPEYRNRAIERAAEED